MEKGFLYYLPSICVGLIFLAIAWYFFVSRWVYAILYRLGKIKFSSYHDEKRGMNEHMRFVRRTFRRMQKIRRTYYFRLLMNSDGEVDIEERDGKRYFRFLCLNTGEVRQMEEEWLAEALHFGIISNAEKVKGGMETVADRFKGEVPEYNKKVGDIDYFSMVIGMYNDDPVVQMDTRAISNRFFE